MNISFMGVLGIAWRGVLDSSLNWILFEGNELNLYFIVVLRPFHPGILTVFLSLNPESIRL